MVEDTDIIKRLAENGEIRIGSRSVSKEIAKGNPKLVIVSSNCPRNTLNGITTAAETAKIPLYSYKGTSLELGEICRKPFPISAMAVIAPGNVNITQLMKEAKA